jgi:hypothetical protein
MASHCVLLDPFKDACAIDHGTVRASYAQNLVMVAVEVAGMEQSGFPTVESSGGQFAAADPIDVDHVPLFFHDFPSSLIFRAGVTLALVDWAGLSALEAYYERARVGAQCRAAR